MSWFNDAPVATRPSVEQVADALHADACPEDPADGEVCACADYLREAGIILALFDASPTGGAEIPTTTGTLTLTGADLVELLYAVADVDLALMLADRAGITEPHAVHFIKFGTP